jgi:hypothetical protein
MPTLTPADRFRGARWGLFVGDAPAMPVHWYYDVAALHRDFGTLRDYRAEGFSSEFHRGPGQYQPGRARFAGR